MPATKQSKDADSFRGTIIEESLADPSVLEEVKIISTAVEKVTPSHHTPHVTRWTLHTVLVSVRDARKVAEDIRRALDTVHGHWYVDFKNAVTHYIIYAEKVFVVDRTRTRDYEAARRFGLSLGIPAHQVDFGPKLK